PNRKGLELVAAAFGLKILPFANLSVAMANGSATALWAVGSETPAVADFSALEAFVCHAYNADEVSKAASVLLPASPHSEMDGTFVNFEGRAQRFELAYWPTGDSQPHW